MSDTTGESVEGSVLRVVLRLADFLAVDFFFVPDPVFCLAVVVTARFVVDFFAAAFLAMGFLAAGFFTADFLAEGSLLLVFPVPALFVVAFCAVALVLVFALPAAVAVLVDVLVEVVADVLPAFLRPEGVVVVFRVDAREVFPAVFRDVADVDRVLLLFALAAVFLRVPVLRVADLLAVFFATIDCLP